MLIVLAALFVVCCVVGLIPSFPIEVRRAARFFALAAIGFATAGTANSIQGSLSVIFGTVMLGAGARQAAMAWRNFDDRRMARRAEEYEARLNAQRADL
jgi:hypothetical protein